MLWYALFASLIDTRWNFKICSKKFTHKKCWGHVRNHYLNLF